MLDHTRKEGLIPPEQYSKQQSTSEDGTFDKILQADISRQMQQAFVIVSADAANCYDRIHPTIIAMAFFCLGVQTGAIAAMLCTIRLMKFFLRTG